MRSFLFTPGNHARRVEKALTESAADAVILDLEDAVAVSEKETARAMVAEALQRPRAAKAFVRTNGLDTDWIFADLDAVVSAQLDGIVLPKAESRESLAIVDRYLSHLEQRHRLPANSIELLPLIETAVGVANLQEICTSGIPRMKRVTFGAADFTLDVGFRLSPSEDELALIRTQIAIYSRVGQLQAPIDTVYLDVRDHAGLEASCLRARNLGFQGRLCIHPGQVSIVNSVFSPTEEEVAWAEEVVAAFREAEAKGIAAIQVQGTLVDYPVVRKAERILAAVHAATTSSV